MERLTVVLERERALMETLNLRLTVLLQLLAADERRFLARIVDEVEHTSDELHLLDTERRVVVGALEQRLGLGSGASLAVLASAVGSGEREHLERLRTDLRDLWERNRVAIERATSLAHAGAGELRAWLERLATGHANVYSAGIGGATESRPTAFDQRA